MNEIEAMLGTRPVIGGRHPDFGTHNALLSLGPKTYLEIIAPDPDAPEPDRGRLLGVSDKQQSRLATWVLRSEPIQKMVDVAAAAGLELGKIETGSRQAPDGTLLNWQLSDPYAMLFDGAVPFLIDWGNTPHPASSAPQAGELVGLLIEHSEPAAVSNSLSILGADINVKDAKAFSMRATIRTGQGLVNLK